MEMTTPRPYVKVSDGMIIVEMWDKPQEAFCATEDGATAMMEYFAEKNIKSFLCSSSVDFPEEFGGKAEITNIIRRS